MSKIELRQFDLLLHKQCSKSLYLFPVLWNRKPGSLKNGNHSCVMSVFLVQSLASSQSQWIHELHTTSSLLPPLSVSLSSSLSLCLSACLSVCVSLYLSLSLSLPLSQNKSPLLYEAIVPCLIAPLPLLLFLSPFLLLPDYQVSLTSSLGRQKKKKRCFVIF